MARYDRDGWPERDPWDPTTRGTLKRWSQEGKASASAFAVCDTCGELALVGRSTTARCRMTPRCGGTVTGP
ncbi:MAG: hypothetical protein ACRD0J_03450, partial [Acidimicrobiales bacterium]